MDLAVDADLPFLHRLQQGRLGLGRGAVDLVGQQQVAEDRPGRELEDERLRIENVHAHDVGRHQVGRELDAVELALDGHRQGADKERFGRARRTFQKDVSAGQQGHDRLVQHAVQADDDLLQFATDGGRFWATSSSSMFGCLPTFP